MRIARGYYDVSSHAWLRTPGLSKNAVQESVARPPAPITNANAKPQAAAKREENNKKKQ